MPARNIGNHKQEKTYSDLIDLFTYNYYSILHLLFSDRPTLCEIYGYEKLNEELQKKSAYYEAEILGINE